MVIVSVPGKFVITDQMKETENKNASMIDTIFHTYGTVNTMNAELYIRKTGFYLQFLY